jgi:hypothetical protein
VRTRAPLELGLHVVLEMPDQELGHDRTISRYLRLRPRSISLARGVRTGKDVEAGAAAGSLTSGSTS